MLSPLLPPPGLFSDDTTFSSPGVWEDGSNVRFYLGQPEAIGGWVDYLSGGTLSGVCRNCFTWTVINGRTQTVFGTHSKLEVWSGGAIHDITPSGLIEGSIDSTADASGYGSGAYGMGTYSDPATTYFARTWSLTSYGNKLIANPRGGTIYEWDNDTGALATQILNAPEIVTVSLVTPQRQLLAFGCNEELSGDFNGSCIRGSDIEDITDWTTASDNNAFEHILEGGGEILAARLIGQYVAVWTEKDFWLGEFIGNPGQAYRFDRVADKCGIAGPNAVAVIGNTAIWLASDYQFRIWNLGGVPQILQCPVHRDFRDNIEQPQVDKVIAATVAQFGEVWFFYPDSRDGFEVSRFLAYSFRESEMAGSTVWFKGDLARTAAQDAGAISHPLMVTYDGLAYLHENGEDADGDSFDWSIKTSDIYLDESRREMMVRGVYPDFERQSGNVELTLYARPYPMSAPVTKGPYVLSTTETKKDFRASGKLMAAEWSGQDAWRSGKPLFDMVLTGSR